VPATPLVRLRKTAWAPGGAIWCCDFDLAGDEPTAMVPPRDETSMRVLVRLHGEPLGYLTLPRTGAPEDLDLIRAEAFRSLAGPLGRHLTAEGLTVPDQPSRVVAQTESCPNHVVADDLVSVVVCTRDRADSLPACLDRLAEITYRPVEFLIVAIVLSGTS